MQQVPWLSPSDNQTNINDHAWIHRKGAAPTHDPANIQQRLDILPLPGSRVTPTVILQPIPGPHDIDLRNAYSVAHGAGRAMTRSKALTSLSGKYKNDVSRLLVPRSGSGPGQGTWVVCEDKQLVWEEAPEAYKDIKDVVEDCVNAGLVSVLGWCHPRVSYKVRAM